MEEAGTENPSSLEVISNCRMCVTMVLHKLAMLTKEADFDVYFDNEKTRRMVAKQSIAVKDSIKTLLFRLQRYEI